MSTYTLNSQQSISSIPGTPVLEQQPKVLEEAMSVVKQQGYLMRKSIVRKIDQDSNLLYDAFKYTSTMLAELRTSLLLPKYYYELYMAIFDQLRYLQTYLYDAHSSGQHHLSDLYELVQYANNIVPRLYLMITVGSVYMKVSKESEPVQKDEKVIPPVKEIMFDMLDMTRGIQHPTRGLFMRYYLSGLTRHHLPDCKEGHNGNITDSIYFILQNFVEMNKLWVRMQHQGHSRDKDRRIQERRELRLLIGSNLVRLSQLEETTLEMYKGTILPSLLEEVVSCRDVLAQEYLLDVIIQAFPDEFHIKCLDMYLSAVAKLQPQVNVKQIVISLIDRFAGYAARAREESKKESEQNSAKDIGIPQDIRLFDVFWEQVQDLIGARPEFTIEDIVALYSSLSSLALNCYPDQLEYIDRILGTTKTRLSECLNEKVDVMKIGNTKDFLLKLLKDPIASYKSNILTLMRFPSAKSSPTVSGSYKSVYLGGNFTELLYLQPYGVRRDVAHYIVKTALTAAQEYHFIIPSVEAVDFLLGEVCSIMVRDQVDGNIFGSNGSRNASENDFRDESEGPFGWEEVVQEQTMMAQLIHVIRSSTKVPTEDFKDHFAESGEIRIRFTFAPVVNSMIRIAKSFKNEEDRTTLIDLLKVIHSTIGILSKAREYFAEDDNYTPLFSEEVSLNQASIKIGRGLLSPPESALNLYLLGAKVADLTQQEDMCYEFFVEAFTVYEDSISESKAQFHSITEIISTLYNTTVFGTDNYETLITKCSVHCSRLLKRADQCRAVLALSHLFWVDNQIERTQDKPVHRNSKKVLECLQKALKVADAVMDHAISVSLFVEILEKYLWYYNRKNDAITANYINSLIELITNNLMNPARPAFSKSLGTPMGVPPPRAMPDNSKKLFHQTCHTFAKILRHIHIMQEENNKPDDNVPSFDHGFQATGGRWIEINVPRFEIPTE